MSFHEMFFQFLTHVSRNDFYSNNNVDGSYINAADVYIGDVSSMVTDFIFKENKSCIFINSYDIDWRNDKSFNFWNCGKVIDEFEELDSAITSSLNQNKYINNQQVYIRKMIHNASSSSKLIDSLNLIAGNLINEISLSCSASSTDTWGT